MTRQEKQEEIKRLQEAANSAKNRLMEIENELLEIDAVRYANSLSTIIWKLEEWQHK